jgi:AraC family transcriptional regulator of adaptative response / methylphosphotriester-DNA alkyltransferase methyltransferase
MIAEREAREATREARLAIYREVVAILETEYGRPLTLDEVARRLATSPRQVQRAFSDCGDLGFRSHLTRVRMARAAELLVSTDIPVNEVGRMVGYRDASQFAKSFRRIHGMTPSERRATGRVAPSPPGHGVTPGVSEPGDGHR